MKTLTKTTVTALFLALITMQVLGQGKVEDYKRADNIRNVYSGKVFYDNVRPSWIGETGLFTYENNTPDGRDYILVDPSRNSKKEAFDRTKFATSLGKVSGNKIDEKNLPVTNIGFSEDLKSFTFVYDGTSWTCSLPSYKMTKGEASRRNSRFGGYRGGGGGVSAWSWGFRDETTNDPVESPDGNYAAFVKNYNIYIRNKNGDETQLSYDGGIGLYYSSFVVWSPDSKKVMAYKVLPAEKHMIEHIESSPADQIQPKYYSREYPKPGDAVPQFFPQIFNVETGKHIKVDDTLYPNQYSLGRFSWKKNSSAITFEYNKRGHQVYQIIEVDATSGLQTILVDERSKTFIDYSG